MGWIIAFAAMVVAATVFPGVTAGIIASVGFVLLGIAAKLLDVSLYALGAKFDAVVYASLSPVINQLWTAFRDIANILIIGMFVFVAISMILGLQSFNTRRMVARILIIAIFINFSLLFTRIIISSSNFIAGQFYCSMMVNSGQSQVCGSGATADASLLAAVGNAGDGIGRQFMQFLGADGFQQARATANRVWGNSSVITGGFWALLYALTACILMLAAALLFAYICFLLVSRAILFIFLIIMSAPAFAAYLIPGKGEKYWNMWWDSLLRNAIFGPLLIMLLWATFMISRAIVQPSTGADRALGTERSFDKLFSDPTSGSGYIALLVFAIILGMLYASARFASSFSKGVTGFNWAATLPAMGFGLAARAAGFGARYGIGMPAGAIGRTLQERSQDKSRSMLSRQLYDVAAQPFNRAAKREFNMARSALGEEMSKVSGLNMDKLAGKLPKSTGFEGMQQRMAERAVEKAGRMDSKISEEQKEKMIKEAHNNVLVADSDLAARHAAVKSQHDAAQAMEDSLKKQQQEMSKAFQDSVGKLTQEIGKMNERTDLTVEQKRTETDRLESEIRKATNENKTQMQTQAERIKTATQQTTLARQAQERIKDEMTQRAVELGKLPKTLLTKGDLASKTANQRFSNLLGALVPEANDTLAKRARDIVGESGKKKRLKDLAAAIGEEGEKPAPPKPTEEKKS